MSPANIDVIRPLAEELELSDGDVVFQAGSPDVDFYVVLSGELGIVNRHDGNRPIVTHKPGQFSGDIDVLTRRPIVVSGIAQGRTRVLRIIGADSRLEWLPESAARDELGYLLTGIDAEGSGRWPLKDRAPCPVETSIPRVLAAGDIRAGCAKRVGFAVGDGSLAVTCTNRLRNLRV